MDLDRFCSDHWQDIEDDRVRRYEQMFQWRDGQRALVAQVGAGHGERKLRAVPCPK